MDHMKKKISDDENIPDDSVAALEQMIRKNMKVTAEELFKASLESDQADWITFNYKDESDKKKLKEWLASQRPSVIKSSSGIGWISIRMPDGRRKGYKIDHEDRMYQATKEWEAMPLKNIASLNNLAKSMDITSGKWLVHVPPDHVDRVWAKIVTSLVEKRFGKSVRSAKVSPTEEECNVHVKDGSPKHVICIYNADYTDIKEVLAVEKEIRRLGMTAKISYKPDIYSVVGIYRNNKYGLKPTIYSSYFDKQRKMTMFESSATKERFSIQH